MVAFEVAAHGRQEGLVVELDGLGVVGAADHRPQQDLAGGRAAREDARIPQAAENARTLAAETAVAELDFPLRSLESAHQW